MVFRVPLHNSKPNELRHRQRTFKKKEAKQSTDNLFTRACQGLHLRYLKDWMLKI